MKNKRLSLLLIVVAVLLLIPFIAMQFTNEVNFSLFDFATMGILLLSTGVLIDFVSRKVTKTFQRIILIIVVVGIFLIVWAELAVGIFGTPFGGQ